MFTIFRFLASALVAAGVPVAAFAQTTEPAGHVCPAAPDAAHDGSHDFDWEIGEWRTHLRRLENPLTGSSDWVEYEGVSSVRPILDGRANLVELSVEGPSGRIEGVSLRLYDPEARQWALHYANIRSGQLGVPSIGAFRDDCGEFYAQETLRGRAILVRFVIQRVSDDTARFEQAFSDDGGRTWELNWIAVDTRVE